MIKQLPPPSRLRSHGGVPVATVCVALLLCTITAGNYRQRHGCSGLAFADGESDAEAPTTPRLLHTTLVELQDEGAAPWGVTKILVPILPEVADWWNDEVIGPQITFQSEASLTGIPHVHLQVLASTPISVAGVQVDGVHAVVDLPHNVVLEACRFTWMHVFVEVPSLDGIGKSRALNVQCPVRTRALIPHVPNLFYFRLLIHWLLMPWLPMLWPIIFAAEPRPLQIIGVAFLMITSTISISCIVTISLILIQRHCARCLSRLFRIWHLRRLARHAQLINDAYGIEEPCCICLGDPPHEKESLLALLPCRHALHRECYIEWVCTEAYATAELICPLCRRRVDDIARPVV